LRLSIIRLEWIIVRIAKENNFSARSGASPRIESTIHLGRFWRAMDRLLARREHDHAEAMHLDALSDLAANHEDAHLAIQPACDAACFGTCSILRASYQLSKETGLAKSSLSEVLGWKEAIQSPNDSQAGGLRSL